MKVLSINSVPYGSTCNIMTGIHDVAIQFEVNLDTSSGYSTHPSNKLSSRHIKIGGFVNKCAHMLLAKLTGYNGCFSLYATLRLIKKIKKEQYDIIHIHNIHGWYLNIPQMFKFIKKQNIKVIWTLHDCWAFTGHCPHFTMAKCEKWKDGCHHCPQYRDYPKSQFDNSKFMYRKKKKWFTGVDNMTIVTPSNWLADLVKQSFLKNYPVKVINNGIDLSVFKPTQSNFRARYNIPNEKNILLGVSFDWGVKKGLDVFIELSKRLERDKYQIVLVGTNDDVDKQLPDSIISIHRTQNQKELAEIYTAADLFVNPTREENYPTVNMESIACGTPVLTFRTGGSAEILDETCGSVVDCEDIDAMEKEIVRICDWKPYGMEACLERAQSFDMNQRFQDYVSLYDTVVGG